MTEGQIIPPLDVGVRAMCLNQILKSEQIALIQYNAETDPAVSRVHKRKLAMLGHLLEAHPYPHRPYDHRAITRISPAARRSARSPALLAWENEGGAR